MMAPPVSRPQLQKQAEQKRQAMQLVLQLHGDASDARQVLTYARELVNWMERILLVEE